MNSTGHLCPWCGELPVKNMNVFPQAMWACDQQNWTCENCQRGVFRRFVNSRWTAWMKITRD